MTTLLMIKPASGGAHFRHPGRLMLTDGDYSAPHGFLALAMEISFAFCLSYFCFMRKPLRLLLIHVVYTNWEETGKVGNKINVGP